jgi:hypothetical protein
MEDIFEFWSRLSRGQLIHPDDQATFDRMGPDRHGFRLDCLPACFAGRLRSAPVVLLYLSPGFDEATLAEAQSAEAIEYKFQNYKGETPFRERSPGRTWLESRTKHFGDYDIIRQSFAILNIGAYHSRDIKSYASLLALASSRVSLNWAQNYLFPEAEAGRRIVICMRAAAYWGLDVGRKYSGTLFSPSVNRGGYLLKNAENDRLIALVKRRIS